MEKKNGGYDPVIELAKGAKLEAASYDKTQKILVTAGKVTVGGTPGEVEITGIATGCTGRHHQRLLKHLAGHLPLYAPGRHAGPCGRVEYNAALGREPDRRG